MKFGREKFSIQMDNFKKSGFTLIELLVVVAIIGLLASVILAAVNSARDKARIAAGLSYVSSLYQAIGDTSILYAALDEGSGTTARDSSGNGYNGIISTGTWDSFPSQNSKTTSLLFNGTSSYILFPQIDGAVVDKVSMSAWIYPTNAAGGYQGIAGNQTGQGFFMFLRSNQLVCDITTPSGRIILSAGSIQDNKWQQVACVYDGSNIHWIVNGSEVRKAAQTGAVNHWGSARIGYSGFGSEFFQGYIDDVRIYAAAP